MRQNCWQYKNCGREPGGRNAEVLGICMVPLTIIYNGGNGGTAAGRCCWKVTSTLCAMDVDGIMRKSSDCEKCEFYQLVKKQEGAAFAV